jgi:hypothetical protein
LTHDHLQVVSTDHCPFCYKEQKEMGIGDFTKIPNGGPGIEHRMSLVYSGGVAQGRFSVNRFVELVATTPAKLFGLYPRKGTVAIGSDADLVIFDPKREHTISAKTHHMRVDYSMFEGMKVTGMPDVVLSRGRVLVEGEKFLAAPAKESSSKEAPAPRFETQKVWVGHSCPTHTHSVGQRTVVMPITLAPAQQEEMLSAARDAFRNAHAPYFEFQGGSNHPYRARHHVSRLQRGKRILWSNHLRRAQRHFCGRRRRRQQHADPSGCRSHGARRTLRPLRRLPPGHL